MAKIVVLAHGTFDLLHVGHVIFLEWAKTQGDWLVVSITSDKYVRKGPTRPVFPDTIRAYMLSRLRCVDEVFFCHEFTGVSAIQTCEPDIYVKGQDYSDDAANDNRFFAERDAIERLGGKLIVAPKLMQYSSTDLLSGRYA